MATYLIGFCDSILDMIAEYNEDFNGIVGTLDARENDIRKAKIRPKQFIFFSICNSPLRLIGAGTLVAILLLAVVGMDWVTRVSHEPRAKKSLLFQRIEENERRCNVCRSKSACWSC